MELGRVTKIGTHMYCIKVWMTAHSRLACSCRRLDSGHEGARVVSAAACAQLLPPAAGQMRRNNTWLTYTAFGRLELEARAGML